MLYILLQIHSNLFMEYGKIRHNIILPTENEWTNGGIQPKVSLHMTIDYGITDGEETLIYVNLVGKKLKNNYYKSNKFNNLILRIHSTDPKVNSENLLWNMHYNLKGEGGIQARSDTYYTTLDPYTDQQYHSIRANRSPSFLHNTYKIIKYHSRDPKNKVVNLLYKEGNNKSLAELE